MTVDEPLQRKIQVVSESFDILKPHVVRFVTNFYDILFTDYPAVMPLFAKVNMEDLKSKLSVALVFVVHNIRNTATFVPTLKSLGARHVQYGAKPEYYPAVGATLIKALKDELEEQGKWTEEVEDAWVTAFELIAKTMLEGAEEDEKRRASLLKKFKLLIANVLIAGKKTIKKTPTDAPESVSQKEGKIKAIEAPPMEPITLL